MLFRSKSSAVVGARNLHGELLLVHGSIDDNVHPQNTIRMARALQDANKPFEMMIYPGSRHGIGGRHYTRLQYDFIRRTMGVDGQESIPSPGDTPPPTEAARRRPGNRSGAGSTGAAPAGSADRQE